jgi:ribosomal protein L40E
MKISYTTHNGRINVQLEADSQKALWKELAHFQEVFEETRCGKCDSNDLRFIVRSSPYEKDGKTKEADYHELKCNKCGAKLAFGVLDDGSDGLFPKRKDKTTGKTKGKKGWVNWDSEKKREY